MQSIGFLALHLLMLISTTEEIAEMGPWCQEECTLPDPCEEESLFASINQESRRLYNSLDCEGKNRAICLSKQYANKNKAVEKAAKEMGRRQLEMQSDFKDYQEQKQQQGGQDYYNNNRFGY